MINRTYLCALLITTVLAFPVMAKEMDHVGCEDQTVMGNDMGMMNEEALQKHISQMEASMEKVKRKGQRREERREMLKTHMAQMQQWMKELHNMKLMTGCDEARHGASMDARMAQMEKRMDMMHAMMQQMLDHQQESERE